MIFLCYIDIINVKIWRREPRIYLCWSSNTVYFVVGKVSTQGLSEQNRLILPCLYLTILPLPSSFALRDINHWSEKNLIQQLSSYSNNILRKIGPLLLNLGVAWHTISTYRTKHSSTAKCLLTSLIWLWVNIFIDLAEFEGICSYRHGCNFKLQAIQCW